MFQCPESSRGFHPVCCRLCVFLCCVHASLRASDLEYTCVQLWLSSATLILYLPVFKLILCVCVCVCLCVCVCPVLCSLSCFVHSIDVFSVCNVQFSLCVCV